MRVRAAATYRPDPFVRGGKRKAVAMKKQYAPDMAEEMLHVIDWKKAKEKPLWLPGFFGSEEFQIAWPDDTNKIRYQWSGSGRHPATNDVFDFSTREYPPENEITWHSDGYDYEKRIVGCTEGSGQLWFAKGPFRYCDPGYKGSQSLSGGALRMVRNELLRFPLKAGDVIAFTRTWERTGNWFHGGPSGKRSGFVCRFV